jgi:predicted DNA-binding antitoxin AbrB/MazE fold protein
MGKTIQAVYDGAVFHPAEPPELQPDTHVWVTIKVAEPSGEGQSSLRTARSLALEGPPDWAANLDTSLYGRHGECPSLGR